MAPGSSRRRCRARSEGGQAWANPEEYRQVVAKRKRAFEDQVDLELALEEQSRRSFDEGGSVYCERTALIGSTRAARLAGQ
jgi:hypothetical protein